MTNPAASTPFFEEILNGSLTTVPVAGRAGQSCAIGFRKENPQTTTTTSHFDTQRISSSFILVSSQTEEANGLSLPLRLVMIVRKIEGGKYQSRVAPDCSGRRPATWALPASNTSGQMR